MKILQNHGDEFQRRIEEDEVLQKASTTAMEGTDNSSQSNVVTRVLSHLRTVIGGLFEVDENGERETPMYIYIYIIYVCVCVCVCNFINK